MTGQVDRFINQLNPLPSPPVLQPVREVRAFDQRKAPPERRPWLRKKEEGAPPPKAPPVGWSLWPVPVCLRFGCLCPVSAKACAGPAVLDAS